MSVKDFIEKDYYAALGVPKNADADSIKKAYRKLAITYHPDKNKGDAESEERFKEISEAYNVLGDDARRAEYDEIRSASASGGFRPRPGGGGGGAGFSDLFGGGGGGSQSADFGGIFGDLFGGGGGGRRRGPRRGDDYETQASIGFRDAVDGVTVPLRVTTDSKCSVCAGSGARPGSRITACPTCQGLGQVSRNAGGFAFAETCPACHGRGQVVETPCSNCHGRGIAAQTRTINARLPAGVRDGQRIRLKGKGGPGETGAPAGDLFVTIHVAADELFGRKGRNLTLTVPVRFDEAALGADVTVPTLQGDAVTLRIPAGTSSGRTFRVKGRGVKNAKGEQGDLLVTIEVAVPQRLDGAMKDAVQAYRDASSGTDLRADLFGPGSV
jgi:molecular chaperone DnaJ